MIKPIPEDAAKQILAAAKNVLLPFSKNSGFPIRFYSQLFTVFITTLTKVHEDYDLIHKQHANAVDLSALS